MSSVFRIGPDSSDGASAGVEDDYRLLSTHVERSQIKHDN
jgi:hypothetical protein